MRVACSRTIVDPRSSLHDYKYVTSNVVCMGSMEFHKNNNDKLIGRHTTGNTVYSLNINDSIFRRGEWSKE